MQRGIDIVPVIKLNYSQRLKYVGFGANTIIIKYFKCGHSYMKADSVYDRIRKKREITSNVLDMDDLK